MAVTVVLLFPLGASYMRLFGGPMVHAGLQIFSLIALLCGFGLGIKLAKLTDYLYKSQGMTHTIFGTVIVALFILQPFIGLLHHYNYKKTNSRSQISYVHIWLGRIVIILAMVNGGLGLKLANNSKNGEIAYGVVAGAVGVLYTAFVLLKRKTKAPFGSGREKGDAGLMETNHSPRTASS